MQTSAPIETPRDGPTPKPPLWKRGWFKLIAIAAFFGVLYYLKWGAGEIQAGCLHVWGWFAPLFVDWKIAGRAITFALAMAALCGVVMSVFWFHRGRRVGNQTGKEKGREEGLEEGRRDGYKQGHEVGVKEGHASGFAVGHEKGVKEGVDRGRQQEQELHQFPHYEPLRLAFADLAVKLADGQLSKDFPNLVSAYASVITVWNGIVAEADRRAGDSPVEELRLATRVLVKYLEQLPRQKNPSTNRLFLPANFEVYARCVASVLKTISSHRPKDGGTIRVWTHLRKPIERWYNVALGHNAEHGEYAHSYDWWEEYKEEVRTLRTTLHSSTDSHFVQMRRVVSLPATSPNPNEMALFIPKNGKPLTIADAKKVANQVRDNCPNILSEIKVALEFQGPLSHFPLHLIGKCNCPEGKHDDEWDKLKRHFDDEYHDGVVPRDRFENQSKGVYCAYDPNPAGRYDYDDVFLVDMTEVSSGLFGIAYYKDNINDLSGIVFLKDAEIQEQMKVMADTWKEVERTR